MEKNLKREFDDCLRGSLFIGNYGWLWILVGFNAKGRKWEINFFIKNQQILK